MVSEADKRDNNKSCNNPSYVKQVLETLVSSPEDFDNSPNSAQARQYEMNQSGNNMRSGGGLNPIFLGVHSTF